MNFKWIKEVIEWIIWFSNLSWEEQEDIYGTRCLRKMSEYLEYDGQLYNKAFLKRCECLACGENTIDMDNLFFRISFRKESIKDTSLQKDYGNIVPEKSYYICSGCLGGLVLEYPEVIQKIERCFPK